MTSTKPGAFFNWRLDMGMEEIVNLATQAGLSVVIILYFLYKDYKFNENIITVLNEVKEVLMLLKGYHHVE